VIQASKFIGKPFSDFESNLSLKSQRTTSKFGLERRVYKKEGIVYSTEEKQDNNVIDEISIAKIQDPQSHELWYGIVKTANEYPNFKFIKAVIAKNKKEISDKELTFNELIDYLRSDEDTAELSYFVDYTLNNLKYSFAVIDNSLFIVISVSK
jgi:hypothetical protein